MLAGYPKRLAGEESEDLRRAQDLADALGPRFAFLARELLAELVRTGLELQPDPLQAR